MELPQGQTGSVGTSVASAEQVHLILDIKFNIDTLHASNESI